MAKAVLEEGESEIADAGEDDRAGEQDFEAVEVVSVELGCKPEEEIVENGAKGRSSNPIWSWG